MVDHQESTRQQEVTEPLRLRSVMYMYPTSRA